MDFVNICMDHYEFHVSHYRFIHNFSVDFCTSLGLTGCGQKGTSGSVDSFYS